MHRIRTVSLGPICPQGTPATRSIKSLPFVMSSIGRFRMFREQADTLVAIKPKFFLEMYT